jgi:hypothetical protein
MRRSNLGTPWKVVLDTSSPVVHPGRNRRQATTMLLVCFPSGKMDGQ